MPDGAVLIVGSINADLVVSAPALPGRGETVTGGKFDRHNGGKGANQAVAAARLGGQVTFVGAVGDDEYGVAALEDLRREGIDTRRIAVLRDVPTGIALIVVDEGGENQIAVASGANARVDAAFATRALADFEPLPGSVWLANLELADDAVNAGAAFAAEHGMIIVLNPAPARELRAELLGLRPILVPNEVEAMALTGEQDPLAAARVLTKRSGAPVIVTLGAAGALFVAGDVVERLPAPLVEAVDTTGAGDTFAGALVAELARGTTALEAARVAVRAASLSVTARGARNGMPTRAMLG